MLKVAFFPRSLAKPIYQLMPRFNISAFHISPERRNFCNISAKKFSNSKSCRNGSSFLNQTVTSQVTVRSVSSAVDVCLTSITLSDATPTILSEPTFHSLGLAHYYPSGWLQAIMEQMHLQCEMPWWATIMASKFLLGKTFISCSTFKITLYNIVHYKLIIKLFILF